MTDATPAAPPHSEQAAAPTPEQLRDAMNRVRLEVGKAVVGQDGTVTGLLIALLSRGHVLLEGVPGVAKTLLVRAFSTALGLDTCLLYTSPSPRDLSTSRMPSSA